MATLWIDSRGRMTLPRHLRQCLGVEPNGSLSAEVDGRTVLLAAAAPEMAPLVRHVLGQMERGETRSLREFALEEGIALDDA